jgi:hypothetical protein
MAGRAYLSYAQPDASAEPNLPGHTAQSLSFRQPAPSLGQFALVAAGTAVQQVRHNEAQHGVAKELKSLIVNA